MILIQQVDTSQMESGVSQSASGSHFVGRCRPK